MPRVRPSERASRFRVRLGVFAVLAVALIAAVGYSLWPKERAFVELGPAPSSSSADMGAMHSVQPGTSARVDLTMRIDMEGFSPSKLSVPVDRSVRLMLVNPDNSHHSDGGGIHQFAVPALGIDVKVPPLTNMIVTLPMAPPGEYPFYCDTCCGGKDNPAMQGLLTVGV